MKRYIATLVLSPYFDVLIQLRNGQASYLVDGPVSDDADPQIEAARVTQALCGAQLPVEKWKHCATIVTPTETVECFYFAADGHEWSAVRATEDQTSIAKIDELMVYALRVPTKSVPHLISFISYAFRHFGANPPVKLVQEQSIDGLPQ